MDLVEMCCCACQEATGLSDHDTPEEAMRELLISCAFHGYYDAYQRWVKGLKYQPLPAAHIIFTEALIEGEGTERYGERFAKYIRRHRLGTVKVSAPKRNPNYKEDHIVRVYTWTINHERMAKFGPELLKRGERGA